MAKPGIANVHDVAPLWTMVTIVGNVAVRDIWDLPALTISVMAEIASTVTTISFLAISVQARVGCPLFVSAPQTGVNRIRCEDAGWYNGGSLNGL